MKTFTSLLILSALGSLPDGTLSFTAYRPLACDGSIRQTANRYAPAISTSQQLHGLQPSFLTRNKSTDLAVDTTDGDASVPAEGEEEELSETKKLLQKVKQAGTAGAISYALWELGFWGISIPVCVVGYQQVTGHWPDFTNKEDMEKVGAEAFAFVNFARLAVPLRIGLALSTTQWIDENVVQKFNKKDGEGESDE